MNTFEINKIITLPTDCGEQFNGIAFDGCFFYLTVLNQPYIHKFDQKFKQICCFETDQPYSGLCYDCEDNCFWSFEHKLNSTVYKLNCDFKRVASISFKNTCSSIKGLSYNCDKNSLVIAYSDRIIEISKKDYSICTIQENFSKFCSGVLSVPPYHAIILNDEQGQKIEFYDDKNCILESVRVSDNYFVKNITFYPCEKISKDEIEIILLVTNDCNCTQILHCRMCFCSIELCCCNYKSVNFHSKQKCKANICGCNNNQCGCDLIESIALVETAISHVLNAEGEKLQKAVEISKSVDDLLEINKSINKTLENTISLENVLRAKLDVLNELCKKFKTNQY